jgi:hypothetical protein
VVADPDQLNRIGFGKAPGDFCRNGSVDGGVAARCTGQFCESFDSDSLDTDNWDVVVVTPGNSVNIDTSRAFRGHGSLKAHLNALKGGSNGATGIASLIEKKTFPASDIFVRQYVFVPGNFPKDSGAIMQVELPDGSRGISLQLEQGGLSTFDDLGGSPLSQTPAGMITPNQWVCVEWQLQIAGSMHAWIDGKEVTALATLQPTDPTVGQLSVGLVSFVPAGASGVARDLWIDEVVVDSKRIGCLQ